MRQNSRMGSHRTEHLYILLPVLMCHGMPVTTWSKYIVSPVNNPHVYQNLVTRFVFIFSADDILT